MTRKFSLRKVLACAVIVTVSLLAGFGAALMYEKTAYKPESILISNQGKNNLITVSAVRSGIELSEMFVSGKRISFGSVVVSPGTFRQIQSALTSAAGYPGYEKAFGARGKVRSEIYNDGADGRYRTSRFEDAELWVFIEGGPSGLTRLCIYPTSIEDMRCSVTIIADSYLRSRLNEF